MGALMQGNRSETGELKRIAAGDQAALAGVFQQYRPRLRKMVQLRLDRRLQGRVEAQIFSIQNWWNYQREASRFVDHPWSSVGWKGEKEDGKQTGDGLFIDQSVSASKPG